MYITLGKAKSTQARVSLETDLFDEYICGSPSIQLALNLNTLLDCLEIFGSSSETTTATMTYSVSSNYTYIYICTYIYIYIYIYICK
jgi:hypothetical protein